MVFEVRQIEDDDELYRRIAPPFFKENGTISSSAYKLHSHPDREISVNLAIYGAIHLVPQTIHKRKEQQIQLQQAQTYSLPPGRSISQETKIKVFARDGGRCVQCGSPYDLQYDHIIPFSLGGGNGPENIQILCGPCNRRKYNNI